MASLFFRDYSIEQDDHAPCNQDNENENRCDAVHLIFTPQSRFLIVLTPELCYIEPERGAVLFLLPHFHAKGVIKWRNGKFFKWNLL